MLCCQVTSGDLVLEFGPHAHVHWSSAATPLMRRTTVF